MIPSDNFILFNGTEFMFYNLEEGKCSSGDIANGGAVYQNCQFVPLDGSLFVHDTVPGFTVISAGGYDLNIK